VASRNAVDRTVTTVATPSGSLLRRTVTAVVDKRRIGTASVSRLKRLIRAAAGLVPSRGDRLTVVVTPFARSAAVASPGAATPSPLLGLAVPGMWAAGGVLALQVPAA
jgi:flagellar biosynthesis/type III secretory pathway M-ring protein FliF/YscJ